MKRKTALLLFGCLVAGWLLANESVDLAMIWKIKDEGLERSQVMDTLSYLTDVYGPRLTGSPNMKNAQEWAQKRLKEWGMINVHLEGFPFGKGWVVERISAEMLEPAYSPLIAWPKSWSPGTQGPVTAGAIVAIIQNEGDFEKYRGKLKGMFVLTQPEREVAAITASQSKRYSDEDLRELGNAPQPGARRSPSAGTQPSPEFQRKLNEFYLAEGVSALLEAGRGDGGTLFVTSARQRNTGEPSQLANIVLSVEHYNRIVRILQKKIPVQLRFDIATRILDADTNAHNVIAEIPGSDRKNEVVMVGAHFDSHHAGTGATDNAAGSAVAMEVMRILRAIEARPRRTIRMALWSGEEQGLRGSAAYVSEHFASRPKSDTASPAAESNPVSSNFSQPASAGDGAAERLPSGPLQLKPDYANFSVYFNLDNGTGKIRGIYLQGNEEARPIFAAWMEPFRDMGMTTLSIRNTTGTDHLSYDRAGLPGFQFIQDPVEYDTRTHHSNMDVYERIQKADMMQASVIMASFVWNAAMREQKFPRKPLRRDQVVLQPKP